MSPRTRRSYGTALLFLLLGGCVAAPTPARNAVAQGDRVSLKALLRDSSNSPVIETKSAPPWDGLTLRWERANTPASLTISSDGLTISWKGPQDASWLCSQATARMKEGVFAWEFVIEEVGEHQIGVGAMLDPPNWGAFGYLGAGSDAWAYDAYEGAIVTEEGCWRRR